MADQAPQLRLTEKSGVDIDYARIYHSGVGYTDLDGYISKLTSGGANLWTGNGDELYLGSASAPFTNLGFRLTTGAGGGTFAFAYSTAASTYTAFDGNNPYYNGCNDGSQDFGQEGFIAWQNPPNSGTAWASINDGNGVDDLPEAYWLRITLSSGHSAPSAVVQNFLRGQLLNGPLKLTARLPDGYVRDITGSLQKRDLSIDGPWGLEVDGTFRAFANVPDGDAMARLTLAHWWMKQRKELYIEDPAQTTIPDLTSDAYYKNYTGRLVGGLEAAMSPSKMKTSALRLLFKIDASTEISL